LEKGGSWLKAILIALKSMRKSLLMDIEQTDEIE